SAPVAPPDGPVGAHFVASAPWALLAVVWGAWLGSMVESAVEAGAASRIGALIVGPLLAVLGAALAYTGSSRHGVKEAAGRALIGATTFAWQGAWLGALMAGGFAASGGAAWVIVAAFGAVLLGGLIGLGVGWRLNGKNLPKILNTVVWGGVIGGFAASFLWSAPAGSASASSDPVAASSIFGPSADWIWRTVGAAPLILAAVVWWVRWMRAERIKEKDGVSWGLGVTALLFVAAMAAGLGAIVAGFTQLGIGYLVYHVNLTPTAGAWLGALVSLFFWGVKQQPQRPAANGYGTSGPA
ncbi:MAG TPA: hypothetical protein VMS17_12180, partial [Gemmataceae bacterium]|nr:hypothetical protein [Gemmataceae bacterium]